MLIPENEFLDVDLLGQRVCASPSLLLCTARTHPGRVIAYQEWMKVSVFCTVYEAGYHQPFLSTKFRSAGDSQFFCVFILHKCSDKSIQGIRSNRVPKEPWTEVHDIV